MVKCGWSSKFGRFRRSCMTSSSAQDDGQPSISGVDHVSTNAPASDSLPQMDLRNLCDQIFVVLNNIEVERQGKAEQALFREERQFWPRLAYLPSVGPVLQQLLLGAKPNFRVLDPYFPKGENDTSILTYMIFRDAPRDALRLEVGLLSLGAALEFWAKIEEDMKEECFKVFQEICKLAKLLLELRDPMTPCVKLRQLQQELQRGPEFLVEGAIMCSIHANGSEFKRLLCGCSHRESLWWLLRKMKPTCRKLCSFSETLIFRGIRSSPLTGRPGMSYPHHAVGIEREVQEITEMLEWRNRRKEVIVIVSGPAGIGKTTVADAVFTSLHIPLCNYMRFTWSSTGGAHGELGDIRMEVWTRYIDGEKTAQNSDDDIIAMEEDSASDEEANYQKSEAAEDQEHQEEVEDDEEDENEEERKKEEEDYEHLVKKRRMVDLVFLESDAAANDPPEMCSFIYIDTNEPYDVTQFISYVVHYTYMDVYKKSSMVRILITTRDANSTWKAFISDPEIVHNEDCMYKYVIEPRKLDESKEIMRAAMGESVWTALFKQHPSSSESKSDEVDVQNLITMCEGIPGWLVLVGKYLAAAHAGPHCAAQELQRGGDADDKWENMMKVMTLGSLSHESMNALQLLCHAFHKERSYFTSIATYEPEIGEIEDILEKHVVKDLQDRGFLIPVGNWGGSVRVPYLVWHYCVTKFMHMHSLLRPRQEARDFHMQLRISAAQLKTPSIHTIHIDPFAEYRDRVGVKEVVGDETVASNLHALANTLQMLCSLYHSENSLKIFSDNNSIVFGNVVVYQGPPMVLQLPWHMLPSIRRMRLILNHQNDVHAIQSIPQGLSYLEVHSIAEEIQLNTSAWDSIARLTNLRAFTLSIWNSKVEMPMEFCAVSNNIRELNIICSELYELPDSFGQLRCLQTLRLECPYLRRLPRGFGLLQSLKQLSFICCPRLEELCSGFSNLGLLHTLMWVQNETLFSEPCWKEVVKLESLRLLILSPKLHGKLDLGRFSHHVDVYYTDFFSYSYTCPFL